ncbi:Heat shock factor 2-binding protein [Galemys pyrenaicus]|uniref:Heat shock factor 2-binding protein n=1 Tax=Galemys pyrenaicus TaxID=202257 RepID=A0A8J5ZU25_GALPY|nr:Heat shock factor 2-binding protein [Galemys pyrenaicus]
MDGARGRAGVEAPLLTASGRGGSRAGAASGPKAAPASGAEENLAARPCVRDRHAAPSPRLSLAPPSHPRARARREGPQEARPVPWAKQAPRRPVGSVPGAVGGGGGFSPGPRRPTHEGKSNNPAPARQLAGAKEEFVKVRKKDLERLTAEVMQIRDFLPRILNGEVLESFQKLKIVEKSEWPQTPACCVWRSGPRARCP